MIRYVAIGAVVGFLFAYFLLSRGGEESAAPVAPPAPVAAPVQAVPLPRPKGSELMKLQPLPSDVAPRSPSDARQP
jgi:hypothetical protein